MPSYPVKQPDGKLAIWSTIVDHFTAFDCDVEGAVEILSQRYRDSPENLAQWCQNTIDGGRDHDFMQDWPDCLGEALARFGPGDETVKEAMERTPDLLMHRYSEQVRYIWRLERIVEDLREELKASKAPEVQP